MSMNNLQKKKKKKKKKKKEEEEKNAILTFSMLSNIVKSISQPTDVFSNFFPYFLNF